MKLIFECGICLKEGAKVPAYTTERALEESLGNDAQKVPIDHGRKSMDVCGDCLRKYTYPELVAAIEKALAKQDTLKKMRSTKTNRRTPP